MDNKQQSLNDILLDKGTTSKITFTKLIVGGFVVFVILAGLIVVFDVFGTGQNQDTFLTKGVSVGDPKDVSVVFANQNPPAKNQPLGGNTSKSNTKTSMGLLQDIRNSNAESKTYPQSDAIKSFGLGQDIRANQTKPQNTPPSSNARRPKPNVVNVKDIDGQVPVGYYIQVAALYTEKTNPVFLESITKSDYTYRIYKVRINNKDARKIIIGPYETREQADAQLSRVRQRIEKKAYILKVN